MVEMSSVEKLRKIVGSMPNSVLKEFGKAVIECLVEIEGDRVEVDTSVSTTTNKSKK